MKINHTKVIKFYVSKIVFLGNANFLMKFKKNEWFSVTRMHIRRPRNKAIKMISPLFVQKLAKPMMKLNNALK